MQLAEEAAKLTWDPTWRNLGSSLGNSLTRACAGSPRAAFRGPSEATMWGGGPLLMLCTIHAALYFVSPKHAPAEPTHAFQLHDSTEERFVKPLASHHSSSASVPSSMSGGREDTPCESKANSYKAVSTLVRVDFSGRIFLPNCPGNRGSSCKPL